MDITIRIDDSKPHLKRALSESPDLAKAVIKTFVDLMEESFDKTKGMRWVDVAPAIHKDLSHDDLVKGVLRGALDIKAINPDVYDVLKVELHPLSLISPRKNTIEGGVRYTDWKGHFKLPEDTEVNGKLIETVIRKILRYNRYVNIESLQKAIEYNQLFTHRGLGDEQVRLLPFYPALRYQREHMGDLHVGKFFDDIGFLDCGELTDGDCKACGHGRLVMIGEYSGCEVCNAGYKKVVNE